MGLLSYVLFSYQSPYVVISSFYRALEPSLNKLWIEDFIFGKKKFFSQYLREGFAIYLRYCVFIREIWVPLRNERWRLVTGPIVVVRVMTIGDVHSTVGTLWLTLHHPLQQSPAIVIVGRFSLRDLFFSPLLLPFPLVIDLRTSLSEIKLHTYELTGTGKPVHPETSIFAKFSFRRILNYVQLFFSTSISNEISGYFEECSRMYKKKSMISTEQLGL